MIYALFSNHWRRLDLTLIQVTAGMNCFDCVPKANVSCSPHPVLVTCGDGSGATKIMSICQKCR